MQKQPDWRDGLTYEGVYEKKFVFVGRVNRKWILFSNCYYDVRYYPRHEYWPDTKIKKYKHREIIAIYTEDEFVIQMLKFPKDVV